MAHIDCTRISQVVSNLINNAAKYSPTGSTINVALSEGQGRVIISVADDGQGIEPELLPKMFEAFHDNRMRAPGTEGLGIGLWLSRQLVDMHGGLITVHSDGPGRGAEFRVKLPLRAAEQVAAT